MELRAGRLEAGEREERREEAPGGLGRLWRAFPGHLAQLLLLQMVN